MDAVLDAAVVEINAHDHLPPEIQDILTRLKTAIDTVYAHSYKRYARVRAFFVREYGQDSEINRLVDSTFRMTKEQFRKSSAKARRRVLERNVRQTVIHEQFVTDVIDWLKANFMTIDKIALLMLCCGARRCEIMDTGRSSFSADGVPRGFIRQDGLAKKSTESKVESAVKPLLFISSAEFMAILDELRRETADLIPDSNGLISQFDNRLEDLAKTCFPQFVLNDFPVGTHVCRAIYVNTAYHYHHNPRESLVAFASRVLGHEGLASVPNYLHVTIAFDRDDVDGKEATDQESAVRGKMAIIEVQNSDGESFRLRPIPHRRLSKTERMTLKTNRLDDLHVKKIDMSSTLLKFLKLI